MTLGSPFRDPNFNFMYSCQNVGKWNLQINGIRKRLFLPTLISSRELPVCLTFWRFFLHLLEMFITQWQRPCSQTVNGCHGNSWLHFLLRYSVTKVLNHTHTVIYRDHSFLRHAEFWAKPQNLPISSEFLCFRGILRNSVLGGDKGTNTAYFGRFQAALDS